MSSGPVPTPPDDERPYHHGDLRQALIDTGIELAREGGPNAIVLREAARRLGVSRTAAYRHFANYDELVGAVKRRALTELGLAIQEKLDLLRSTGDGARDASRRLVAIGECYLEFAFREPGLFRVAFGHRGHALGVENDPSADSASRPFDMLARALDGLVEVGLLSGEDRKYAGDSSLGSGARPGNALLGRASVGCSRTRAATICGANSQSCADGAHLSRLR